MNTSGNQNIRQIEKSEYLVGDLVFGKLRGYPHWPGQIIFIDREKYKNVIKYRVKFFASEQSADLNKNDICKYNENKLKYTLDSVAKKHKPMYEFALKEIHEESKVVTTLSPHHSKMIPLKNQSNKKLNLSQDQYSTPKSSTIDSPTTLCEETPVKGQAPRLKDLKDAGTSTPSYMDLQVQLEAMTNKVISLEKSATENESCILPLHDNPSNTDSKNESFHIQILKQELNKLKLENQNLLLANQILQSDLKKNEELLEKTLSRGECLICFPTLQQSQLPDNAWKTVRKHTPPFIQSNRSLETNNPYGVLEMVPQNVEKNLIGCKTANNSKARIHDRRETIISATNNDVPKTKLTILADSQGSFLDKFFKGKTSADFCVFVKSGANFKSVTDRVCQITRDYGKNDHILVIGGTNDMGFTIKSELIQDINNLIQNTQHTNLILSTVPMRYDVQHLDLEIAEINTELEKIARDHPNIRLLPTHLFPRHFHTPHGLHFNRKGRATIAQTVANILEESKTTEEHTDTPDFRHVLPCQKDINVIDGNMAEIIVKLKNNPSVGFAHTISADFTHPKHMSAGVAVTFRQKFGRPDFPNYSNGRLTCQNTKEGAAVYSLVTKFNYYGKPSIQSYDGAFDQLTEHFLRRGLKLLVCSPMGCVRDLIELRHFAKNIIRFQRTTNSTVCIVSCDQVSHRVLRGGLSHPEFLKRLQEEIEQQERIYADQMSETSTPTADPDQSQLQHPIPSTDSFDSSSPLMSFQPRRDVTIVPSTPSTPSLSTFPSPSTPQVPTHQAEPIPLQTPSSSCLQKNIVTPKIVNPI